MQPLWKELAWQLPWKGGCIQPSRKKYLLNTQYTNEFQVKWQILHQMTPKLAFRDIRFTFNKFKKVYLQKTALEVNTITRERVVVLTPCGRLHGGCGNSQKSGMHTNPSEKRHTCGLQEGFTCNPYPSPFSGGPACDSLQPPCKPYFRGLWVQALGLAHNLHASLFSEGVAHNPHAISFSERFACKPWGCTQPQWNPLFRGDCPQPPCKAYFRVQRSLHSTPQGWMWSHATSIQALFQRGLHATLQTTPKQAPF